jgi:hypothetical protein
MNNPDSTDAIKDPNQLPLFNREAMILAEGYRCLAAFKIREAEQYFNDVIDRKGSDTDSAEQEEARRALETCEDWQPLVLQNIHGKPSFSVHSSEIYKKFSDYDFANVSGIRQFQNALLRAITNRMLETGHFNIDKENKTSADLLMELGRHKKAEEVVMLQMERDPADNHLCYCLAEIQWKNNKRGEAKKNYARGLLYDPCRLPYDRLVYKKLSELIDAEGPEMAPAFGWVRGILPLVYLRNDVESCSNRHSHAVDCYRLLWAADKALQKRNLDSCIEYRKQLKAKAPTLYDEYFSLLENG